MNTFEVVFREIGWHFRYLPWYFLYRWRKTCPHFGFNKAHVGHPPTILLHGHGINHTGMVPMARHLRRLGMASLYIPTVSYDVHGKEMVWLREYIEKVREEYYQAARVAPKVRLVGHSFGGVSAMTAKAEYPDLVGTTVSIAGRLRDAPPLYKWGDPIRARMIPRFERLARFLKEPPEDTHSVIAENDWLVPHDSSRLPNTHLVPGEGHLGVGFSFETAKIVKDLLDRTTNLDEELLRGSDT